MLKFLGRPVPTEAKLPDLLEGSPQLGSVVWVGSNGVKLSSDSGRFLCGKKIFWPDGQKPARTFDCWLVRLRGATVHTVDGFIQLGNGEFIRSTYWTQHYLRSHSFLSKYRHRIARRVSGNWFSLLMQWGRSYYHWFCDVLPRLANVLHRLPDDTRFIIPPVSPPWVYESLQRIGIPQERCTEYQTVIPWQLENLFYAPPMAMTGDVEAKSLNWVRSQHVTQLSSTKALSRIYVSRAHARCRNVVNEGELIRALEIQDFQVVFAESLTLDEQITMFSNAEAVVAPHGAGLTNILWMCPDTLVIELFEPTTLRRCYWSMSTALSLRYNAHLANSVQTGRIEPDMAVDVPLIVGAVRELIDGG